MHSNTTLIPNLWNDAEAKAFDGYRLNYCGTVQRARRGPPHHELRRRQHKLENREGRSFHGSDDTVLAVKGSGGDLGSIKTSGFALLYMDKLNQLKNVYKGEQLEDEMVAYYPLCAFGTSSAPASIDTPLHAFLPFKHVDHLHPDWAIAIAASANGKAKLEEFNRRFKHNVIWLPWQRPGFELGLMLQRAVEANPGCDGIILGSHGLFTWGKRRRSAIETA